jgi:hypothetical protein
VSRKKSNVQRSAKPKQPAMNDLLAVMAKLRSPEGCPWDRQQDHQHATGFGAEDIAESLRAAIATRRFVLGANACLSLRLVLGHQALGLDDVLVVGDPDPAVGDAPAAGLGFVELDPVGVEHRAHVVDLVV